MKFSRLQACCYVVALQSPQAIAEIAAVASQSLDDELKFLQAEAYVITASKVLEHKDRSISTISIITQEQIKQLGAKDLQDVLSTVPGINTIQGGFGAKQIGMRGITSQFSEKVLILLNGHPLDHNLTNGGSSSIYDNIALDNVKRIEIVRGPGSLLYGANAFMGTINIITKHVDDQQGLEATATGGSFGSQQYNVYSATKIQDVKVTANGNFAQTDGIQGKLGDSAVQSNLSGQKYDLDLNLEYQDWNFTGHFADKETGSFAGFSENLLTDATRHYQDYFFILKYQHDLTDKLKFDINGYHDNFNFDNMLPLWPSQAKYDPTVCGATTSAYCYNHNQITNTKSGAEAQFTYQWFDNNQLVVGFKGETQDQFDITHTYGPTAADQVPYNPAFAKGKHRTLASGFVQDIWDVLPNLRFSAGARYDRYSDFGNTFNPRAGFNWEFLDGYILRFSYGTSFRAPTFGETGGTNAALLGNINLQPEMISTNEIGFIANPIQGLSTSITAFDSTISNMIRYSAGGYTNSGGATSQGVEIETKYYYSDASYLAVNYTLQKVQDAMTQQDLRNVPNHFGNVMLNQELVSNISLLTHVFIKGDVTPSAVPSVPIASYALLNSTLLAKDVVKDVTLSASVYNWLDTVYYDPAQYSHKASGWQGNLPTPERSVFIRASFKY